MFRGMWWKSHTRRPNHVIIKETTAEQHDTELLTTAPQVSANLEAHVHLMWCLPFCLWHHGYANERITENSCVAVQKSSCGFSSWHNSCIGSLSTATLSNNQHHNICEAHKCVNETDFSSKSCVWPFLYSLLWEHVINSLRVLRVRAQNCQQNCTPLCSHDGVQRTTLHLVFDIYAN